LINEADPIIRPKDLPAFKKSTKSSLAWGCPSTSYR
jgi:hypothetical protein